MQNKVPENRQVKIKNFNEKCQVEKAQDDQNVTANGIEKIKRACRVKPCSYRSIKLTAACPILNFFARQFYAHLKIDSTGMSIKPKFYYDILFKRYSERNTCYDMSMMQIP